MISVNSDPNPKSSISIISLSIALKQNKNNKEKQIVSQLSIAVTKYLRNSMV